MKFTKSRWNTFLSLCQPCSQLENGDKIDLLATRQEQRSPLEVAYALVNGMFENDRTRAISSPLHHELFLVLGWFLSLSSHNKLKVSVDSSSKFSLSSLEHLKSNLWLKIKKKKKNKTQNQKKNFLLRQCLSTTGRIWHMDMCEAPGKRWPSPHPEGHLCCSSSPVALNLHLHFPF